MSKDTTDQTWSRTPNGESNNRPRPGVVVVFAGGRAVFEVMPLGSAPAILGRDTSCELTLDDHRASRRHASVSVQGAQWSVRDLGSRNGTFVNGTVATHHEWPVDRSGVLSVGDTVSLLLPDVQALIGGKVETENDVVLGPRTAAAWRRIELAAQAGTPIHLVGETGTGKELAARHYHAASARREGRFIAVNCAAVPAALAERLLFGAKRGAYSGADTDTEGYLTSAHKGTLFLDELGELPLEVQAKLLRAVDTLEVLPLGASQTRAVDVQLVSASHGELRDRIVENRFRDDLYFRLCQMEIVLPPLRDRLEEVSWMVQHVLRGYQRKPHASLIEAVLQRPWPGNVRELNGALAGAATSALGSDDPLVRQENLARTAGQAIRTSADEDEPEESEPAPLPADELILAALREQGGNVVRAARALGLSRGQVRRWLTKKSIDPKRFAAS